MNCDGVRGLLSAYLDGELSPGELLRVEQHLRRCHACADEVDALRQTISLVQSMDEVEVPASFRVSLHERLVALGPPVAVRRVPAARTWQRSLRTWAMPAAAAAAVLAVGISQLNQGVADGMLNTRTVRIETRETAQVPPVEKPPVDTGNPGQGAPSATGGTPVPKDPPKTTETPGGTTSSGGTTAKPPPAPASKPGGLAPNLQIYTASILAGVTEPKLLPAQETVSYSLTASVADPAATVVALQKSYGGEAVPVVGKPGVVTSFVLTLPAVDVAKVLADIRTVLGQNVTVGTPEKVDIAAQLDATYEQLKFLDAARQRQIDLAYGKEDQAQIGAFQAQLERITADANKMQAEYADLQKKVSTATITVYLQK